MQVELRRVFRVPFDGINKINRAGKGGISRGVWKRGEAEEKGRRAGEGKNLTE